MSLARYEGFKSQTHCMQGTSMEVCPGHGREEHKTATQQQAGGFRDSLFRTLIQHQTLCLVHNSILMSFLTRSPQCPSPNPQTPSICVDTVCVS